MHLADRRGGDRHLVEREERLLERQAELLLDHPPHVGERERRHVVLQAPELGDDVGRHHVGTGREQLTELDEGRAELVEHLPQAPAAVGELGVVVAAPAVDQIAEAVAGGDAADLGEPADPSLGFRRRHPSHCGRGSRATARAGRRTSRSPRLLEQPHAMLELRDAEGEVVRLLAPDEAEAPQRLLGRVGREGSEPLRLRPPAREHVANRAAHRVALDADPAREVVGDVVGRLRGQRGPAEPGE